MSENYTHKHNMGQGDNADPYLQGTHASMHTDEMNLMKIVREIMTKQGWNQSELANELKLSQPTISRWFKGSMPDWDTRAKILALAYKLNVIDRTYDDLNRGVPVVGYVGAGAQIIFEEGQGPFGEAIMPPGNVPASTVAVEVRGDSMSPMLENGWMVYYDNRQEPPPESLYKGPYVVGMVDGRVLVKKLIPGSRKGTYHLLALNGSTELDQSVAWAARVTFIEPGK